MQITKRHWIAAGVGFVVAVLAGGVWLDSAKTSVAPLPVDTIESATSTDTVSTTEPVPARTPAAVQPFPLNASDTIVSWSFKGAYTGSEVLVQKATEDIAHLTSLMGKGEFDDYDLYIGIGNDYNLMGDGRGAYQNFNRAVAIHPKKGLALVNIAHLMDELGAYRTAADAYTQAVTVESSMLEYHLERLIFLTRQFAGEDTQVLAAFADTAKVFGDSAPVLAIKAQWLTGLKRYTEAIPVWETVKALSIGRDTSSIDTEIARLKAKQ
ncbi:MAG: tetratricopeptide repeat protein [Candidatus Paceibacterota bacterium]